MKSLEKPVNEGEMLMTMNKDKFKGILRMTGEVLIPEAKYYTGERRATKQRKSRQEKREETPKRENLTDVDGGMDESIMHSEERHQQSMFDQTSEKFKHSEAAMRLSDQQNSRRPSVLANDQSIFEFENKTSHNFKLPSVRGSEQHPQFVSKFKKTELNKFDKLVTVPAGHMSRYVKKPG